MKSCHYILQFICLNTHPEWWSFLPGASWDVWWLIMYALYFIYLRPGVFKIISCKIDYELQDGRMANTWATESRAAGVCVYVLKQPEQPTKWGGPVRRVSAPLLLWEDGRLPKAKSLIPVPPGASWAGVGRVGGPHRSDINKKSQLITLFTGLMSLSAKSRLSGVKAATASVCVCGKEEIRALKDLRSLCVELLIDRPNIIYLLIRSRIWWCLFSG